MIDSLSGTGMPSLLTVLDATMKVSLLLAIAGFSTSLMGRQSAASRHAVWVLAVIAALAVPPMESLLPAWRVELLSVPQSVSVPASLRTAVPSATAIESPAPTSIAIPETATPMTVSLAAPKQSSPGVRDGALPVGRKSSVSVGSGVSLPTLSIGQVLFMLWAFGCLATLAPLALGLIRVRAFASRTRKGLSPLWQSTLEELPETVRSGPKVRFLESGETAMPLACGIFHPTVIVPANAEPWPAWKRRNILVHELAHVQRWDCLTQLFATILCAIYWFNPLAWVAASRMRFERELACDDRVLEAGSTPVEYADHLLEVARSLRPATGTAMAAIAMARQSHLSNRLVAVLDSSRSRRSISARGAGTLGIISLLLVLPLAAFSPWKAEVTNDAPVALDGAPATSMMAPAPVSFAPMKVTVAEAGVIAPTLSPIASLAVCQPGKGASTHISDNDDSGIPKLDLKFSSGDCTLQINAVGKFTFADDLSDVATLAPGGTMSIQETSAGTVRRLELRSVRGDIQRRFLINGTESAFGERERQWLAETLLTVERRTGFSARTRVTQLWQGGGVKAVLEETSRMATSYAKRLYLQALFDVGINFDGATLTKIIRLGGSDLTSDYDRRMVLVRLPGQKFMDDNAWNAYAEAVARMGSDHDKRMTLKDAFEKGRPSPAAASALLGAASSIHSSYELSQLLSGPVASYSTNQASRSAYLAALRNISSDFDRRNVFLKLIDKISASPETAPLLLEPAGSMTSDYEKSELIRAFARRGGLARQTLESLVGIAGSVKSDYEKHRALSGIISSDPKLSTQGLSEVLTVARSIGSDYELGRFLQEIVTRYPAGVIPREAFDRALASIGSDTDANAVRSAMRRSETR